MQNSRVTAVLGPTNTGKTHYAIERMLAYRTGVIGLPLRLLAREVYDISKIKYNEGVGSNLEVVEADAALIEAEINYLTALYDGLVAKVDLEKALGILSTNQ